MSLYSNEKYEISPVAEWFHVFPHVDIGFNPVNSTFDPSNNAYLEALGIIIAIPGFWLILTLLAFLIFFLCRCCDSSFKRKKKLTGLKWTLGIFAVLCCGALAVGLFGNDQAHNGVVEVETVTRNLANMIISLKNQTNTIEFTLHDDANSDIKKLDNIFGESTFNKIRTLLEEKLLDFQNNLDEEKTVMHSISEKLDKLQLTDIADTIDQVEIIRWPVTIALLCLLIILCLILIWGLIRHSRCLLILFSVLGLLSVVVCWVLVSLYVGLCVAGSDYCLDPEPFLYEQANGVVKASILSYYLHCDEKEMNPFSSLLKDSTKVVENMENTLINISSLVNDFVNKELKDVLDHLSDHVNQTDKLLVSVSALLDCQNVHSEYNAAMDAICTKSLEGTTFMLLSAAGAGLFFTVLIWVASHTWIHIRKKPPSEHIDEEDPFLPPSAVAPNSRRNRDTYGSTGFRPRHSHTPPQTPHFTASLNGHSGSREDHAFLQGRYSPPPAYDQLSGGLLMGNVASKMPYKA